MIPDSPVEIEEAQLRLLPDGAISVESEEGSLVLRASEKTQSRYEELMKRQNAGTITEAERDEYSAICQLDDALSWLNRLARIA